MQFLESIQIFLDSLDMQRFYRYTLVFTGIVGIMLGLIVVQYYRKVTTLKKSIAAINQQREIARGILGSVQHVKKDQREVDELIRQSPDFNIIHRFKEMLGSNIQAPKIDTELTGREGKYQERTLNAKLVDMSMKELAELLQKIEQNKRVYPKVLEIVPSRKTPNAIDVNLSIATLEPRQEGELSE